MSELLPFRKENWPPHKEGSQCTGRSESRAGSEGDPPCEQSEPISLAADPVRRDGDMNLPPWLWAWMTLLFSILYYYWSYYPPTD